MRARVLALAARAPTARAAPEAARTAAAAAWAQLAKTIVLSLKPAGRTLDTRATSRKLGAGREAFTLATPDGWAVTTQPGPDFTVYHLRKLAILGAPAVSCGIYLGDHASYQLSQSRIDPANVKTSPAKLSRSGTLWQTVTADRPRFTTEAMASHPAGARPSTPGARPTPKPRSPICGRCSRRSSSRHA